MRRAILLLGFAAFAFVASSGVGLAAIEFGTERNEFIEGTGTGDVLHGGGGSDSLAGRGGNDVLHGGSGGDALHGGSFRFGQIFEGRRMIADGRDTLFGNGGDDCVWGGSGDDVLHGGDGNDFVGTYCLDFIMDTGSDVMYAGAGNDDVMAVEAPFTAPRRLQEKDIVYCGPGVDTVFYQKGVDRVFGCERKNPR